MRRVIVFFILFGFGSTASYAQKRFRKNDVLVKFHPLALVDFFPAVEIAGSYFLKENLAFQLKLSQKTNWINLSDSYSTKGNRFSGEVQYFFRKTLYLALELGYMKNQFSDHESYRVPGDQFISVDDEYNIKRQRFYFVPKFGLVLFCSNSIMLETYTEIGLQYRIKEVTNLEFDKDKGHIDNSGYFFFGPSYNPQKGVLGKFSLGFSVNYNLYKMKSQ